MPKVPDKRQLSFEFLFRSPSEPRSTAMPDQAAQPNPAQAPVEGVSGDRQGARISTLTNDQDFDYQLIRSRRRSLDISVHHAQVIVRAPLRAPLAWIEDYIQEKSAWIRKHLAEQTQQLSEIYRIIDGASLPVLEQSVTVRFRFGGNKDQANPAELNKATRCRIHREANTLLIDLSSRYPTPLACEQKATAMFFTWIKSVAEQAMVEPTQALAQQISRAEQLGKINFRRTSSKWGHCTSAGDIQYNPLIVLAPHYVMKYIIAHEVCHLAHANHSKTFWRLVDKINPDRHRAERWLKERGHQLAIEIPK